MVEKHIPPYLKDRSWGILPSHPPFAKVFTLMSEIAHLSNIKDNDALLGKTFGQLLETLLVLENDQRREKKLRSPRAIFASNPAYKRIKDLTETIAIMYNPEVHSNTAFDRQQEVPNTDPEGNPLLDKATAMVEYRQLLKDAAIPFLLDLERALNELEQNNLATDQPHVDTVFQELTSDIDFNRPGTEANLDWEGNRARSTEEVNSDVKATPGPLTVSEDTIEQNFDNLTAGMRLRLDWEGKNKKIPGEEQS